MRSCLVASALSCLLIIACELQASELNLLIVSVDTLRADHLQTYGYPRETSPAIETLGQESVVFDNAFSQDTNTNPSHTSMFTGVYPHVHGNRKNGEVLDAGQVTLAQILSDAGYQTAGFISGVPMSADASGLDRGFSVYDDDYDGYSRRAVKTNQLALDWLAARDDAAPFFLFVHFYDTHGPYDSGSQRLPPSGSKDTQLDLEQIPTYQRRSRRADRIPRSLNHYVDRYDASIRSTDEQIGRLLGQVNPKDTIVLVVADHGESLNERFWKLDHGAQVFDEQIRIPLILRAPGIAPRRVGALVETVDLLPTLLELLDLEPPPERPIQGTSLVGSMRGRESGEPDVIFSSSRADSRRFSDRGYALDEERRIYTVRTPHWKLIRYPGRDGDYVELYDLEADPQERTDVAGRSPELRDRLLRILESWLGDEKGSRSPEELDPELLEQLKSLGYVGG